jgi:hypothetical protein
VSFFGVPGFPRLTPPLVSNDNELKIASILDLAGTKASVVQLRAEAKDYRDIDALITKGNITLPMALTAAQALYGVSFNPQIALKSLSFFDDGDLRSHGTRNPPGNEGIAPLCLRRRFPRGIEPGASWDYRSAIVGVLEFKNGAISPAAAARATIRRRNGTG